MSYWATESELTFLENLGTGHHSTLTKNYTTADRIKLYQQYEMTLLKRRWDTAVDLRKISRFIANRIIDLRAKENP